MYNTLNLSIFSLYLKALEFILAPNLKKKIGFILEVVLWDLP